MGRPDATAPETPNYYAIIPADVRYDDALPANAKLLYGEISALTGAEGYCFAGNGYFAQLYGLTDESVSRLIARLERAGHLRRVMDRDDTGQIIGRRLYLTMSAPDAQPLDEKINTPYQKNQGGIDKKVKENITSNNIIKKENKKEKGSGRAPRVAMDDEHLQRAIDGWIGQTAASDWSAEYKALLSQALHAFYAPREDKKHTPARTDAAFATLTGRLARISRGNPALMLEMLERATCAGWKSVYPLRDEAAPEAPPRREGEIWL